MGISLLLFRAGLACLLLALCLAYGVPVRAQISNETLVNNHATATSYSRSYTPAAGSSRVVIAIIFSEYESNQNSAPTGATLNGVAMQPLGTIEGTGSKRNRLTAYIMRENALPAGAATFRVTYGPDPAASLIYLATVLNVDQASAGDPPRAFGRYCSASNPDQSGTMSFAAVPARANDYVFSFVGTGSNTAQTTFNNGAIEFFDERVFGPGFSFAGGVQVPQLAGSIAGTAFISSGCDRRPATLQLVLRPLLGSDGVLTAPLARRVGDAVEIEVIDADRNTRAAAVDTLTVTVTNRTTGEQETVVLSETGPNTGIFRAALPTQSAPSGSSGDGVMAALPGQILRTSYADTLNTGGAARTLMRDTRMRATDAPARLTATKTSAPVGGAGASGFHLPGEEVLYTIRVRNEGDGAADDGVFIVDTLPAAMEFFHGPPALGDSASVRVVPGDSGTTFSAATDLRFSNAAVRPTSLSQCTYTPVAGHDPQVRHVCIRLRDPFLPGTPPPEAELVLRARIR
ncbi:hypothetical protein EYB45_08695 [Erythrobacteraceae bacterium CFH 75059]|uniref:hypothetical protein n=1 Tax=Qipengyuania thermophila TaxID=2509361 RepID=UPI0010220ADA|nr:hypothetical protein [Qipengyuania thermophila]TCD04310.1 hypothetical protein EYB45_08695 [Erythrobacteraceae bacterium CFH 75059]